MTTYSTIITNNGKAMFASAATSSGRVNITHLAVGDGNGSVPTPKANQTRLIKEAHRVTVNSVERHATNANWIEIGAIIPSSSGGYTVREIGLYAGNTLIAVGSFPATYKPAASEGGAREMSIRIIITVENAAVVNVTLDNSLVYATRQWVESNFVNHNEVIDNLTSTDTDKPLSANQGKVLKDGLDGLTTSKADKTTNLTAGNGLTGGGNLSASRTVALGTPGQITATSTNGVTATSHTHAIDKASTTVQGIVQLNDTLTSTATNQALTAAQGKVLKDGLDGLTTSKADKTTNLTAGNGLTGGGNLSASRTVALGTPSQITAGTTNSVTTTSHTHAIDKASTTVAGVVQLNDTLTSTATNQALTAAQGKVLKDGLDGLTTSKADKTTNLTAGNGLTGGGNLSASRTVALGTPSQITAGTTNSVTKTSHTHAIDKASTAVAGVVQLNDTLTSTATNQALTAAQGKKLNDEKLDIARLKFARPVVYGASIAVNLDLGNRQSIIDFFGTDYIRFGRLESTLHNSEVHHRITNLPLGDQKGAVALGLCLMGGHSYIECLYLHSGRLFRSYINFNGPTFTLNWIETAVLDGNGNVATAAKLATARNIALTGDGAWNVNFDGSGNATGVMTLANTGVRAGSYNSVTVDAKGRVTKGLNQTHGLVTATSATGTANVATSNGNTFLNIVASGVGTTNSVGSSTQITGTNGISISSDTAGKLIVTRDSNSPTATKLQTPRTISLTGAVTGSVSFNGSANVSIATTLQQGLGVGQSWRDVSASRSSSVTYTNSTGRPIFVRAFVTGGNKNLIGYVNGMIVDRHRDTYNSGVPETSIGFIVPNGATYRIYYTHADTVILELR